SNGCPIPYITWHLKTMHVEETYYASFGAIAGALGQRLRMLLWWLLILAPAGRVTLFLLMKSGNVNASWLLDRYFPCEAFAVGGLASIYLSELRGSMVYRLIGRNRVVFFVLGLTILLGTGALRDVKPFSYMLL